MRGWVFLKNIWRDFFSNTSMLGIGNFYACHLCKEFLSKFRSYGEIFKRLIRKGLWKLGFHKVGPWQIRPANWEFNDEVSKELNLSGKLQVPLTLGWRLEEEAKGHHVTRPLKRHAWERGVHDRIGCRQSYVGSVTQGGCSESFRGFLKNEVLKELGKCSEKARASTNVFKANK